MLSLDAKDLGYSALIQVVKSKTAEGFVPNSESLNHHFEVSNCVCVCVASRLICCDYVTVGAAATSVNKARHSQPPVGSKILLEIYRKYREEWIVDLLFDDL